MPNVSVRIVSKLLALIALIFGLYNYLVVDKITLAVVKLLRKQPGIIVQGIALHYHVTFKKTILYISLLHIKKA